MEFKAISCPTCLLQFKQEKKFLKHIKEDHNIIDVENFFVITVLGGKRPTCACSKDCKAIIPWLGWKKGISSSIYARGHNAKKDSIFLKNEFQKQAAIKRKHGFATKKYHVWNSGLKKNKDEKINVIAEKISLTIKEKHRAGQMNWRVQDPEKAKLSAQKISETKKQTFKNGLTKSWNTGLTKETDARLSTAGHKISLSFKKRQCGKRLTNDQLLARIAKFSNFKLLSDPNDYRTRRIQRLTFECTVCKSVQSKSLAMLEESPLCFKCNPKESVGQIEIFDYVKSLTNDVVLSDRILIAPKEIDVLVKNKLAIEYDGLYWHSELFLDKTYASEKLKQCDLAGVKTFRIFEDEWKNKSDIVKAMIRSRLGLITKKVYARKCVIKQLILTERKKFFEENHLEGDVNCKIAWGLFFENELIAALSLRRPFHKKYANDSIEIARFCQKQDISVPGALSKLVSAASKWAKQNNFSQFITYVDRRLGDGAGYIKSGFQEVKAQNVPRFWWTDFKQRFNRFSIKANSKMAKTERAVAKDHGVYKIFGCANAFFVKPLN